MNEDQNKNQLPKDWKWEKVSSVADLFRGINYTKDVASNNPFKDGLPILRGNNINGELNFDDLVYVPKALIKKEQFVKKDDIIFAMSSGSKHLVGKSAVAKNDFNGSYGAFCALLRISEEVNKKYISYIFKGNSYRKLISEIAKGTNINNLKREHILDFELPLPPKSTQQAIVSKIEELFSELDKGIENLRLAQQQLKIYRQSVLKWAFEGRLTNENVKEGELPKGWKLVKTIDVIHLINNGYTPTKEYLSEGSGEIPFIKVYNLNFNGTLNFKKNPTFIPNATHKKDLKRSICFPGDVLINIVGPPLGKVSVVTNQYPEWNINQAIVMFRPNEKVLSKYISYFMQNSVTINWLENTSKATAGQWNVKVSTCREIPFPFCSIEEQNKIIQEIESRLSVADKMEESITQCLQQTEALRQSILKKAFEGKLITEKDEVQLIKIKKVKPVTQNGNAVIIEMQQEEFPKKKTVITETDLHAGIIAMVIEAHGRSPKHLAKLNHVKCEKIADQIERKIGISLGRKAVKDAAGPDDYPHLKKVEHRSSKAGYFKVVPLPIGHTYKPLRNLQNIIAKTKEALTREELAEVNKLIQTFLPFELEHAELVATIFAGWNNLLITGLIPTDEQIVYESRENWSKRKLSIDRENFFKTLDWMKQHDFIPQGKGAIVLSAINKNNKLKTQKPSQRSR